MWTPQTAQGINRIGATVEGQSVSGVSRTLDVVFWARMRWTMPRDFSKKCHNFTKGKPYTLATTHFTRFVLQKTPYFSSYYARAALFAHALQRKPLLV